MPNPKEYAYTTQAIRVLKGLESARIRPGMYVGNVHDGTALHHLVWEVLENSINEFRNGHGTGIEVVLAEDGRVTLNDNGRGIPVEIIANRGVSAVEIVMTTLHAGGKFNNSTHAVSASTHGVGVSVVNALSEELVVEIRREGHLWRQEYRRGIPQAPLTAIRPLAPDEATGTSTTFHPDPQIFTSVLRFDPAQLRPRLQELACLYPTLTLVLKCEEKEEIFHTPDGISSLVSSWCACRRTLLPSVTRFSCSGKTGAGGPLWAEVALQFAEDGLPLKTGWMNDHRFLGGTPFLGATAGIMLGVRRAAKALSLPVKRETTAFLSERLVLAIRIEHPSPQYGARTRDTVTNKDITRLRQGLGAQFRSYLLDRPEVLRRLVRRDLTPRPPLPDRRGGGEERPHPPAPSPWRAEGEER